MFTANKFANKKSNHILFAPYLLQLAIFCCELVEL